MNVLSKYVSSESATAGTCNSFMEDIKKPALQLVSMYALQVGTDFAATFCGIMSFCHHHT